MRTCSTLCCRSRRFLLLSTHAPLLVPSGMAGKLVDVVFVKPRPLRPEVLELDTLLTELSLCCTRTQLYFRFLIRRASMVREGGREGEREGVCD